MKYNISKKTASKMPKLGKGTEIVSLLLSQASNDMHEPIVPMIFLFSEHTSVEPNACILTSRGRKCAA